MLTEVPCFDLYPVPKPINLCGAAIYLRFLEAMSNFGLSWECLVSETAFPLDLNLGVVAAFLKKWVRFGIYPDNHQLYQFQVKSLYQGQALTYLTGLL